jgi:hypothetical protein
MSQKSPNLLKMIEEFREELACLDEVIIAIAKLTHKRAPKRGRPPLWTTPTEAKKLDGRNGSNGRRHAASASAAS